MASIEWDAGEDEPFLAAGDRADEPISSRPRYTARPWQAKSPRAIVLLLSLMKFGITSSGMLLLVPVYRLIEDAICHVYYDDDSDGMIDEMKCKVKQVQSRLAYIMGWVALLNSVVTLLLAYPYGMLADRIGRKPVAFVAYFGLALSFAFAPFTLGSLSQAIRTNPYVLMLGSLFLLVGGGLQVLLATLYAMAADVSDEKDKAASFLYLTFGATAGGLLGPVLAGLLMQRFGPWVPIYIVLAITPFIFCLFAFIPETLSPASTKDVDSLGKGSMRQQLADGVRDLVASLGMLKNRNIPLVLVTFLFQNARFSAYIGLLAQYISTNFGWTLAETSLLLSPLGVLNLLLLAVLPTISKLVMSRLGYNTFEKDLFLTRVSTFVLIVGALIEAFSHNIVLFIIGLFIGTFGAADSPLARATVSHYVEPEYTSRLYGLISIAEVAGSFLGAPVLAWLFERGLDAGGIWMGLPYFYIAVICTVAYLTLTFVQPPRTLRDS
ncbi:hypothetical protein S7711_01436 [Stachybotrys chartarum IBT 7711]|uniref:Major facilitator superfamily (MFS) profile domain-containing protein n=1 Tax=Stachybotrys chartarum (strain CBS 109288 / IBT 7711) TaxID=1280523 RepID=A0A084B6Z1_STACB|nr:hypothetical protein S7711_01436 [Stachybotrys chartarum IBT 7711]KFA55048.1 hypothetical protein S40293_03542 [Stachybotrys chartarum IBT 40293]KFA77734.1 hypothetical protein S40288_00440 [Stachybotrys chartarum IBT 40288]